MLEQYGSSFFQLIFDNTQLLRGFVASSSTLYINCDLQIVYTIGQTLLQHTH